MHEVYHKVARRFLEVDCDERVGKGKRDKGKGKREKGKGDFSNGNDISKSCKK